MSEPDGAIPPLVVEFAVAAPVQHCFDAWVSRQELWWPRSHTVSGDPRAIVIQPRAGGRMFERDSEGAEHPWGEVLTWDHEVVGPITLGQKLQITVLPMIGRTLPDFVPIFEQYAADLKAAAEQSPNLPN